MVDLLRASLVTRAAVFGGFCLALATVWGCAAGTETTTSQSLGSGGGGGHATTSSSGGKGGANPNAGGGGSGAGGAPLSGKLEVCVLNDKKEDGQCQTPAQLDFGTVSGGSQTMRLFRIDNGTNKIAELDKASIASNEFKVVTVRYEDDPGNPGQKIRVVQALPETRKPGESLWFEVTWDATGTGGPIPASKTLVLNKVDNAAEPDLVVPMVGMSDGCPAGTAACDSDPTNGCETNTNDDPNNCGACGKKCQIQNGTGGCMNGQCIISTCNAGFADCDLNPNNGCETNTLNDSMHCGSCMQDCTKHTQQANCVGGNCNIVTCATGYADCNLNPNDGCETNVLGTDNANCGGCNIPCAPAHANGICQAGSCTLGACAPGYQDCDTMPGDGCEVNTDNDPNHCGSCASRVQLLRTPARAAPGGTCALGACDPNFSDCDGIRQRLRGEPPDRQQPLRRLRDRLLGAVRQLADPVRRAGGSTPVRRVPAELLQPRRQHRERLVSTRARVHRRARQPRRPRSSTATLRRHRRRHHQGRLRRDQRQRLERRHDAAPDA